MQFGEGPLGVDAIGLAGLWGHSLITLAVLLALAFSALRPLPDVGQLLQADKRVWMLCNDLFADLVVCLRF